MAYIDYGLGLGLAYKFDFDSANRFKMAAVEMGQREAERKYQRERDARQDEDRLNARKNQATQEYYDRLKKGVDVVRSKWAQAEIDKAALEETTKLGTIPLDPNWQQSMDNQVKVDQANARLQNNPAIRTIAQAKSKFDLAMDDYEKGVIKLDKFKEEERKYNDFLEKGPSAGVYDYQPMKVQLTDKFDDYYGQFTEESGKAEERKVIDSQFYKLNYDDIHAAFESLEDGQKKYFASELGYVQRMSQMYTNPVAKSSGSGGYHEPTEYEKKMQEVSATYKELVIKTSPEGTDEESYNFVDSNISAFIPSESRGGYNYYTDPKIVLIDENQSTLDPNMQVKKPGGIVFDSIKTPVGTFVFPETTDSYRKIDKKIYIETEFQAPFTGFSKDKDDVDANGFRKTTDPTFNKLNAKGRIISVDMSGDVPVYRFKAFSPFSSSRKAAIEYNDAKWGNADWQSMEEDLDNTPRY
ncbi:MAG: hypothetical protein WC222_11360 [Parachlamydiales bacterium]|jgi:hypothetical protein